MADPFSMATGAVGIVAFGIQVCGGVLKYLSAVKDRHKELAAAWDAARTLAAVLERLNGFIARIHPERPEDVALLSRCLEGARGPLLELRKAVAKLEGLPEDMIPKIQDAAGSSLSALTKSTGSLREKTKNAGHVMAYKFHQDDVKELRVAMQQLTTSLNTAILTVGLDEASKQGQDIKSLQASISSVGSSIESKSTDVCSAIDSLASQSHAAAADLQVAAQENASKLREIQDGFGSDLSFIKHHISTTQEAVHGTSVEVSLLRAEVKDQLQAHGLSILAKLQMMACQLETQNRSATDRKEAPQVADRVARWLPPASLKQALDIFSGCQCRASTTCSTTHYLHMYGFSVFSRQQSLSRHERHCPLHALTQKHTRAVGARMCLRLGSFLSCLIEANFGYSTGAGTPWFGPSVRWKNLVHCIQSPVRHKFQDFSLWMYIFGGGRDTAEVLDRLEKMQKDVVALYQKGEASINDIDEHNKNHLQYFVDVLVRLYSFGLLTSEVVKSALPMVQLYVEMGLTCDERHESVVYTSVNHPSESSPLIMTATTLATSAQFLVPYEGRVIDASVKLVSLIARASDPLIDDVIGVMPDPGLFFTQVLDYESCLGNIPPLVRAILVRSLDGLESSIRLSPKSVLARTHGLTVLHLSIGWPPGLSLLLDTDARLLLDTPDNTLGIRGYGHPCLSWPFSYAAVRGCAQSLDLILQAGCDFYPPALHGNIVFETLSCALVATSAACAEVFARHMARRRGDFFALASSNLDKIMVHLCRQGHAARKAVMTAVGRVADQEPAGFDAAELVPQISEQSVCEVLTLCFELANIPIPRSLRHSSLNVYHAPRFPLAFFPIFERHGFAGYNEPDQHGLRPVMNQLRDFFTHFGDVFAKADQDVLPWLIEHGCLDARPVHIETQPRPDTKVMKIHTGATGWHYISMKLVTSPSGWSWLSGSAPSRLLVASTNLLATIAEGEASCHRDGCVCWCTLPVPNDPVGEQSGGGCSPFSFMCKLYLQKGCALDPAPQSFRHQLFRHKRNGGTSVSDTSSTPDNAGSLAATTPVPTWQLEILRLLTFEALEMTHTCCSYGDLPGLGEGAILSHPDQQEAWRLLSANPAEADKARQLEELMAEFTEQLGRKACTPRDVEEFFFGSWRARITGLYDVNDQELKAMEGFLGGRVRTKVLPEPLQKFFGGEFPFFDGSDNASVHEELHCVYCS